MNTSATTQFIVAPRQPGPEGAAALSKLREAVNSLPGGRAEPPHSAATYLQIAVPHTEAEKLRAQFESALIFEQNAELRY